MPELVGALMVHGQRVDMVRDAEDRLLIPVCPPGVYLAEVRAAGVCVLYGHVEVLPSPLYEQDGVVCYTIDVDAMTDVLAVSLSMVEGIPGPRGEQGIQGERGLQGASAYDLAVAAGYEGSEAEWVAELQGAHAAANAAKESETAAAKSARAAGEDKAAAVQARDAALAAQGTAEEQAAIATKAAEDAQSPESIAAQAARPATMVLLKDELLSLLGDASLFDIDTDGQKIIVHTDRLADDQLAAVTDMLGRFVPGFIEVAQYNHNIEISWRDLNKYADCVTIADLEAVNPDWKNDITSDGEWLYPLTKWPNQSIVPNTTGGIFTSQGVAGVISLRFYTEANYNASSGYLAAGNNNLKRAVVIQPNLPHMRYYFSNCTNLEEVEFYLPETTKINAFFALAGCNALRKLRLVLPKGVSYDHGGDTVNAANLCLAAQLDAESIIRLLDSLPDKSASATPYQIGVGIHVDLQTDEEVLAAIANAEAKGWALTVRWNGTPTSAASVMRFGQLIYAKVGEGRDGEPVLDWGHYVTNWEERGYEQFRSIESAYEYFGLPAEEGGEE